MDPTSDDVKSPLLNPLLTTATVDSDYNSADEEELDTDGALAKIGSWGKFNILLLLGFTFSHMTMIFQLTFSYFIGNDPPWRCNMSANNSQILQYENASSFCSVQGNKEVHVDSENFYERCNLPRSMLVYTTPRKYSYTTEYDFVCKKRLLGALLSAVFFLGFVLNIIVAPATDKYGRKRVALVILFINIVMSLLCSFATDLWLLIVLRFFQPRWSSHAHFEYIFRVAGRICDAVFP